MSTCKHCHRPLHVDADGTWVDASEEFICDSHPDTESDGWRETRVGYHEPEKPTITDVLPLVRAYYAKPGNEVGGSLHLVLDDGNVRDDDVRSCLQFARERADADGVALAEKLLPMSRTQRRKLGRLNRWAPRPNVSKDARSRVEEGDALDHLFAPYSGSPGETIAERDRRLTEVRSGVVGDERLARIARDPNEACDQDVSIIATELLARRRGEKVE